MHKLITITGPSGFGKSTLVNHFFKDTNKQLISFTTRSPRKGEVNGKDYYFITKDKYEELKDNCKVIEYDFYNGNYYGLTIDEVMNKLEQNNCATILTIDGYKRMKRISERIGFEIIPVFIHTDEEDIAKRLKQRYDDGIDNKDNIIKRYNSFLNEANNESFFEKESNVIIHDNSNLSIEQSLNLFKSELHDKEIKLED